MDNGDTCNQSAIEISNHTGTHVDCPFHFDATGRKLHEFEPSFWFCSPVAILHATSTDGIIGPDNIAPRADCPLNAQAIVMVTGHGLLRHTDEYWQRQPAIHPEVASFLRESFPSARFFGFDLISLTSPQHGELGRMAHEALLKNERPILILEDMKLDALASTTLTNILVSPLFHSAGDGAPCTIWGNV